MFELNAQFLIHAGLLRNGIHLECDASTLLFSWSMPEASYFIGATNTSECPGSTQIQDEGAFKTAAASLGIVWNMSGAWFSSPRGCLKDVESTFQPTALGWNPQLESTFQPRALGWNPHSNPQPWVGIHIPTQGPGLESTFQPRGTSTSMPMDQQICAITQFARLGHGLYQQPVHEGDRIEGA